MAARVALAVAACGAAAVLSGCGGGGHGERAQVRDYIQAVNAIQTRSGAQMARAQSAYAALGAGKLTAGQAVAETEGAEAAFTTVRRRIAAVAPPAAVATLRSRLLALFDLEVSLAHETTLLARYEPAAQRALTGLAGVDKRLGTGLRHARSPTRQSRVVSAYITGLGRVITRLERLTPPPVLAGRHQAQLQALVSARALAVRLRRAIAARQAQRVARLLLDFRRQARRPDRGVVLAKEGLKRYRARLAQIAGATGAVQRASSQLQARFPATTG